MAESTRAGRLRKRLSVLDALDEPRSARLPSPYQAGINALNTWAGSSTRELPSDVWMRRGFIRRDHEELPAPPVSQLIESRGHGLQFAMIALFLAQTKRHPGARLSIPVAPQPDTTSIAWADFVVIPDEDGDGSTSRRHREKRIRSAKSALTRLSDAEISFMELNKGSSGRQITGVNLFEESGPRLTGGPAHYITPDPRKVPSVSIPVEFFTRGWVFVLSDAEIATYLMYRHACVEAPGAPAHVTTGTREARYALKPSTWESHPVLSSAGLLDVLADPNRRANGTATDAPKATPEPHRFSLTDQGLHRDGLRAVWAAIDEMTA